LSTLEREDEDQLSWEACEEISGKKRKCPLRNSSERRNGRGKERTIFDRPLNWKKEKKKLVHYYAGLAQE